MILLTGPGNRNVVAKIPLSKNVLAPGVYTSDYVNWPTDLRVEADGPITVVDRSVVPSRCSKTWAPDPTVAKVVEMGVNAANEQPREFAQLIVDSSCSPIAAAV